LASREPDPADWGGDPPVSAGGDGNYEWSVVGYYAIGESYKDFHNFDPESEERDQQRFPVEPFPSSWDFLGETDALYIKSVDNAGNVEYAIIYGPFEDWDDLADLVNDWFEWEYE
jgi:hypothetical protein